MKTLGIISEYNPFHNGHMYHIKKSKEITGADTVIAVMSGNFVQRGEAACADKWLRAGIAVSCGVDLVIELPFVYACNSAGAFARGAVGILDKLGAVDYLSFGSESGSLDELMVFTGEDESFKERLHHALDMKMSYPKAMEFAAGDEKGIMSGPNNILAIEYLKELKRTCSSIRPVTVKRSDKGYHSLETAGKYASASKIRSMMKAGEDYSSYVPVAYKTKITELDYFAVMSRIISADVSEIELLPSAGEGLGNRVKKQITSSGSLNSLIDNIRGSRYTRARISRLLCQLMAGCSPCPSDSYYARILAFNEKGAELLRQIKKEKLSQIPVITNINRADTDDIWDVLKYDISSSDIYNLFSGRDMYANSDYVKKPAIIKSTL